MGLLRVLEIFSLLTTIVGLYLLGEKSSYGFLVFNISLLCQSYIFFKSKTWFLLFQMFVLIAFNSYNYFKWTGVLL
jgi:hypothetical protein